MRVFILTSLLLFLIPSFASSLPIPLVQLQNQPYFESPELMIDCEEYDTIILKIEAKESGTARLFWANSYDPQFNQPKSIWFSIRSGKHSYYFNLPSQNQYWLGWVRKFLIYPETEAKITSAEIIKGNLFTNLASGWQEFWGPNGRKVIGSTINVIPSSSIFGRPVNIYIYWIIGIFFLISLSMQFIAKANRPKDIFSSQQLLGSLRLTIKQTLILIFFSGIILGLNANFNHFNVFKDNFAKYYGKPIEQKRAVAYGNEYYAFLVFAKEKLPQKPTDFGLLSSVYAAHLQARIYLAPHLFTANENESPQYLIAFYPSPNQKLKYNNYMLFAKLNDDQYILKRIEK